jgi:hypothetical protein
MELAIFLGLLLCLGAGVLIASHVHDHALSAGMLYGAILFVGIAAIAAFIGFLMLECPPGMFKSMVEWACMPGYR